MQEVGSGGGGGVRFLQQIHRFFRRPDIAILKGLGLRA